MRANDYDHLMQMERAAIASYRSCEPNGFNKVRGGRGNYGWRVSDETRQKMVAAKAGYVPWNKGRRTGALSAETRAKLSATRKGRAAWNKGRILTDAARARLSESHRGVRWNAQQREALTGRTRSAETRAKLAENKRQWWAVKTADERRALAASFFGA